MRTDEFKFFSSHSPFWCTYSWYMFYFFQIHTEKLFVFFFFFSLTCTQALAIQMKLEPQFCIYSRIILKKHNICVCTFNIQLSIHIKCTYLFCTQWMRYFTATATFDYFQICSNKMEWDPIIHLQWITLYEFIEWIPLDRLEFELVNLFDWWKSILLQSNKTCDDISIAYIDNSIFALDQRVETEFRTN